MQFPAILQGGGGPVAVDHGMRPGLEPNEKQRNDREGDLKAL